MEVTGGEPLLQPAVLPLLTRLCDLGKTVLLETSGTLDIAPVDPRVIKIMDLKCPSSGAADQNWFANIAQLSRLDEIKFVIADRADYEWAKGRLAEHALAQRCDVLFSAVMDQLPLKTLAEWILTDHLPVRLQTQGHKLIWGPTARGV